MKLNACIITNKKLKTVFLVVATLVVAALFFAASSASINGAIKGLHLCADVLIPTLFPFCVISTFIMRSQIGDALSRLLSPLGKFLFNQNGNATCAIFLSMISGYPVGAKLIKLLYEQGQISKKQAENLVCCCVNPGPAFIVLAVGKGILNNTKLGYILLLSNIISCIIINIIFRSKEYTQNTAKSNSTSYSDAFVQSVSDASAAIMSVCAFVILFSSFQSIANEFLSTQMQNIMTALCEVTTAIIQFRHSIVLVAVLLGWCGFSVHLQIMSLGNSIMPKYPKFAFVRLLHGALIAIFTELFIKIFNVSITVSSTNAKPIYSGTAASLPCAIALIFTCIIFLLSVPKNTLGKSKKM